MDEVSYGLLTLLDDEQVHVVKKERFIRRVRKITDNVGVQDGSSISINYDPTYQQLYLHKITVIRDGETIDKLNVNDFQNIRQESNSESYIYDGSLNAIANLSDIRNGDILDVSYSVRGFNPIHGDHFSGATVLNDIQPVGKINYRIISNTDLKYKILHSDLEPQIGNYNGLKTYNWQTTLTKTPTFEDNAPNWYLPFENLFVSDFGAWEDVVEWALEIYQDDIKLSTALKAKIELIHTNSENESERISKTLKFVQDEIRYLGLESGIGAYKPFSPNKVLNQRFGDCKDKSWLMVTMLRKMGVKAYPMLINTSYGEYLHELLPSPKMFDHVVVKVVDSTNTSLFYDPTISNQFGSHKSVAFPDYGKGLVIKKDVTALEITTSNSKDLVEVFDTFDLPTVGGPGTLNVMTVYQGAEADAVRANYKSSSLSSVSKDYKKYYEDLYDGVEVIKPPVIEDDSLANRIIIEESYRITDIWQPMLADDKNIAVELSPYSIYDIFISPDQKERNTPFALYYPTHKKHKVTVKLPEKWAISNSTTNVTSKNFDFSMIVKMNAVRNILYLDYEYENKTSYVTPEDYKAFYRKIKDAEKSMGYYVYIPKSEARNGGYSASVNTDELVSSAATIFKWIIGLVTVIGIGLVIFSIRSNNNRD
jgi:hypothetical protein